MADTWRLVDKRVSVLRDPTRDQYHIRRLGCAINEILREERQQRTEEVGEELERLL